MTDVIPNFKVQADCGCGCGLYGTPKKPSRDGVRCIRGCHCKRCQGRTNRREGLRKQSAARKRLGVGSSKFGDANEERWQDRQFANEVKSGKQCSVLVNWWRRIEAQVLANEPDHGNRRRPVRAIAMPDGWGKDGLVVVKLSTWDEHIRPALDEFYGPENVA